MSYITGGSSSCIESMQGSHTYCMFPIQITNNSNSPISLDGTYYATVDGKVFEASSDTGSTGIKSVSDTWNPGDIKSGMVAFDVPTGSMIQNIFLNTTGDGKTAEVVMQVNTRASIDGGSTGSSSASGTSKVVIDKTGILKRLNAAGAISWSADPFTDLTNSHSLGVFLSDQCGVWVFKDENSAQTAADNGIFDGKTYWIGTDSTSDDGIVLLADDATNVCAQKVVKVMNWSGIQNGN
jgi:hypothetical protein